MIFNNPERHNAISLEMWEAALEIMADFGADPSVRVMVVTGAGGKAFVSGADISKFKDERAGSRGRHALPGDDAEAPTPRLQAMPIPTIAMIRGYCIGGGPRPRICCDLRICTENAQVRHPRRQARPRLRPEPRAAAGRPGRPGVREGDVLHRRDSSTRRGGREDGPGQPRRADDELESDDRRDDARRSPPTRR